MEASAGVSIPSPNTSSTGMDAPQMHPEKEIANNLAERAQVASERAELLEHQAAQQRRIERASRAGLQSLEEATKAASSIG